MGQIIEDFSDGMPPTIQALGGVTSDHMSLSSARSRSGNFALLFGEDENNKANAPQARLATWRPTALQVPKKLNYLSFWWQETQQPRGFMWTIVDRHDRVLTAFATSNPQWHVLNNDQWDNGPNPSPQYDAWTHVRFDFDWVAETFDCTTQRDGMSAWQIQDRPFFRDAISPHPIERDGVHGLDFWSMSAPTFRRQDFEIATSMHHWIDEIVVDGPIKTAAISGTVLDPNTGDPLSSTVRAHRWDNGAFEGEATSNPNDGTFAIYTVRPNEDYAVTVLPLDGRQPRTHGPVTPET